MTTSHQSMRRTVMTALAGLPLAAGAIETKGDLRQRGSRILVAYFSRSGNTRVIAGLIHRQLEADLFEIRPATDYPEDYLQTVAQATKEREGAVKPALASSLGDTSAYDTLFLGFPIWGQTVPPVVRSFLSTLDLAGKTVIPFITHGGYGVGNSQSVLARDVPKARLLAGLVMEADQERRTMEQVTGWLKGVEVKG